jgi:hypothetical protein
MALIPFRKIRTASKELERVQSAISDSLNPLARKALVDGIYLEDIALSSGANVVSHKLGRDLRGYIVCRRSNASTIYDTAADRTTLSLTTSGAITVSLWVF